MTRSQPLSIALLACVALGALFAETPTAEAQATPSAAQIAGEIQAFYDQTTTVRTAFYQSHYDRLYHRTTRSRGVLTIARPGKMRFDYLAGAGKVVVTDGEVLTVYEPDGDGGPGQYAQTALEDGLPSALGFLAGTARLDRDFAFRLRDASALHWSGYVLELRPRRPEPGYRRVLLYVDASPATRGVVRRVLVQDHEGNLNRFDFARMRFGESFGEGAFQLDLPAGARRI